MQESQGKLASTMTSVLDDMSYYSLVLSGEPGSGKTHILTTCRLPVITDSFDTRKTLVLEVIAPGRVMYFEKPSDLTAENTKGKDFFVRKFWNEDHNKPTEYARWRKRFDRDVQTGFYNLFGTYSLDSHTSHLNAASNFIIKKMAREKSNGTPLNALAQADYPLLYQEIRDLLNIGGSLSCDFIVTSHLSFETDEVSGKKETTIHTYRGLKTILPSLVTEHYTTIKKTVAPSNTNPRGVEYKVLTVPYGR